MIFCSGWLGTNQNIFIIDLSLEIAWLFNCNCSCPFHVVSDDSDQLKASLFGSLLSKRLLIRITSRSPRPLVRRRPRWSARRCPPRSAVPRAARPAPTSPSTAPQRVTSGLLKTQSMFAPPSTTRTSTPSRWDSVTRSSGDNKKICSHCL